MAGDSSKQTWLRTLLQSRKMRTKKRLNPHGRAIQQRPSWQPNSWNWSSGKVPGDSSCTADRRMVYWYANCHFPVFHPRINRYLLDIQLWVFNPSLRYSSTSPNHSITTQHAMKILYQHALNIEALLQPESGKASSLSLEELQLPANIFAAVEQALGRSNSLLPVSARGFREWRVGVLDRFQR